MAVEVVQLSRGGVVVAVAILHGGREEMVLVAVAVEETPKHVAAVSLYCVISNRCSWGRINNNTRSWSSNRPPPCPPPLLLMILNDRGTREVKTITIRSHAEAVLPPTRGTVEYTYNPGDGIVTKVSSG